MTASAGAPCARGRHPGGPDRVLLAALLTVYVAWGAAYVWRTSILLDGERYFCLWDDAMVSMRYARNLADGLGLAWNPGGERVQGFSNLGLTLAMAGLHLLPVGPARTSLVAQVGALGALAAVLGLTWSVTFRLAGSAIAAGGAALAVALHGSLAVWGLQGSDVAPVALTVTLATWVVAVWGTPGDPCPRATFAAMAAGVLLRADVTIFYLALLGWLLWTYPGRWRRALEGAVGLAAVWLGLLAFGTLYYGDPLPNPFYLKMTGSPRTLVLASGLAQLGDALTSPKVAVLPVLVAAGGWSLAFRHDPRTRLGAALVVAALAYHVWVGGDWLPAWGLRFVVPAVPVLILGAVTGAWLTVDRLRIGARRPRVRAWAFVAACLPLSLVLSAPFAVREWLALESRTMLQPANARNVALGVYLRDRSVPSTSVGLNWAGATAYFAERSALDLLGRSDRHIARLAVDRFYPGHAKWDWDYVLTQRRPDVVAEALRGLETDPRFLRDYLGATTSGGLQFFVRRDAVQRLEDPQLRVEPAEVAVARARSET